MKPYYSADGVELYCGDSREVIPSLALQDVAATITDCPYAQTSLEWDQWCAGWPKAVPGNCLWAFGSLRMFAEHWQEFDGWKLAQDVIWEKHNGSSFHADRIRNHYKAGYSPELCLDCLLMMDGFLQESKPLPSEPLAPVSGNAGYEQAMRDTAKFLAIARRHGRSF